MKEQIIQAIKDFNISSLNAFLDDIISLLSEIASLSFSWNIDNIFLIRNHLSNPMITVFDSCFNVFMYLSSNKQKKEFLAAFTYDEILVSNLFFTTF